MKSYTKIVYIALLFGLLFASCGKNDPVTPPTQYTFLQSDDQIASIPQSNAKVVFAGISLVYPEASGLAASVKTDVTVHKITYYTTFQDSALLVSGLVCAPSTEGSYPVLCFQNGTNVEYSKAPTVDQGSDLFQLLESVATMGFVVVVPDYPGFGASEQVFHPYLEADNTLPCLLDILKATQEFVSQDNIAAKLNSDLFIMGYSQGGWATMQLQHELETNGIEGYNLKGSSCGAGPYDLNYLNFLIASKDTYPMPYFLAFLMDAYHIHGKFTNSLSDIFEAQYASEIPGLFDGVNTGEQINAALTTSIPDLLNPDYRNGFQANPDYQPITKAFADNSVTAWNVSTPTRLFHGQNDTFVPIEVSAKMADDFSKAGVSQNLLQFIPMPGVDHQSGVRPFGLASLSWFLQLEQN